MVYNCFWLYFQGSAVIATLIQRFFAKLDELGTKKVGGKDQVNPLDKGTAKSYDIILSDYRAAIIALDAKAKAARQWK